MSLSTDIARLSTDIRQAARFRKAAINDASGAVKSTLATCAAMRGEMSRGYRAQAEGYRAEAREFLSTTRRAMKTHMAQLGKARRQSTDKLRSDLRRQVDAMRTAIFQTMMSMAGAREKMAAQQGASLAAGRQKLHMDMASSVGTLHADRMKAHKIWSALKSAGADEAVAAVRKKVKSAARRQK